MYVLAPRSSLLASPPIALSPINNTASASVVSGPHPIGNDSNSGRTPYNSANRTRETPALVRDPSSSASRRTSPGGTRKCSFTLSTGPQQATQASEITRCPGPRKNSTDGIMRHIEPPRRQRVGQPARQIVNNPRLRRERRQAIHQWLAIQIVDGPNSHHRRNYTPIRRSRQPVRCNSCPQLLSTTNSTQ